MVGNSQARFGLLYSVIMLLLVIPAATVFEWIWGLYPHSVGLKVGITPEAFITDRQAPVIVTVKCAEKGATDGSELEFRLSSRPISQESLRTALLEELSRQAHPVVYVEADGCMTVGEVMGVVDIARGAWYGVPVVLLTPTTKKMLDNARGGP